LRAGLLSEPEVIERINKTFVSTSAIIDDVNRLAEKGDPLARQLAAQWEYPVEMVFVSPSARVISKLNSYQDFPHVHPDVSTPPRKDHVKKEDAPTHKAVFLKHLTAHFGGK
jgi:hypothetical protein